MSLLQQVSSSRRNQASPPGGWLPLVAIPCILVSMTSLPASASLPDRSPFLPPGFRNPENQAQASATPPSVSQNANLLFRGVYELEGKLFFNLVDQRTKESQWVSLRQKDAAWFVASFDRDQNSLVVEQEGNRIELELHRPEHIPVAVQTAPRNSPGSTNPTVRTSNGNTGNPVVRRRVIRPSSQNSATTTGPRRPVRRTVRPTPGN
jgi:hypothetical protein